jgi:hypothetical protein
MSVQRCALCANRPSPCVLCTAIAAGADDAKPTTKRYKCWGCGASPPPLDEAPHKDCERCVEMRYEILCCFCCDACREDNQRRHEQWHADKDAVAAALVKGRLGFGS